MGRIDWGGILENLIPFLITFSLVGVISRKMRMRRIKKLEQKYE